MDSTIKMAVRPMARMTQTILALACGLTMISACADDKEAKSTSEVGEGPRVRYDYDALGRLVQATAPSGNGAHYSYDAVGNITAIRRLAADAIDLIDFAPHAGAIGSTVTIFGSGFNTTATNNEVAFNGTAAAVAAATATTLVVTVPGEATSGRITVSNALGSATSANDYVVGGLRRHPPSRRSRHRWARWAPSSR
jgi:YD repeat-containing protein